MLERAGAAGRALARQGPAAHDRRAGGARGAARDLHVPQLPQARAQKLNDRILAVDKAEDGASFLDVFEWYRTEGYDEEECFPNTRRVFRGGVLEGGAPFTKDACYCKGIVLNYAFIRAAIQHKRAELIPFLFVGKVAHEDIPVLACARDRRRGEAAAHLPPMFRDMNGLAIWMAYSTFFFRMGGSVVDDYYAKLFRRGDV